MRTYGRKPTVIFLFLCTVLWCATSHSFSPIIILSAVLIHELGHILAGYALNNRIKDLSPQTGGLLLSGAKMYSSYPSEALIAFAGPAFNLLAVFLASPLRFGLTHIFCQTNTALAFLNLLPISGFDGGRITACVTYLLLPYKIAHRVCSAISFLVLFSLWSISVYLLIRTGNNLTFFLFSASIFFKAIEKKEFKSISKNN